MKVLLLAPQPFFQERGTPIAVRLASEVLASDKSMQVEVLCYEEGTPVAIPNVLVRRARTPRFLRGIGPGVSLKKILSDLFLFGAVIRLLWKCRHAPFDLVHAVEESVFMALIVRKLFGLPYVYDMDSYLSSQLVERWQWLKPVQPLLRSLEGVAVKNAEGVICVCDALMQTARSLGASRVFLLSDVSLLDVPGLDCGSDGIDLRSKYEIPSDSLILLYVGNLEPYQGIDLLIEGFRLAAAEYGAISLVIAGGRREHIESYEKICEQLDIASRVHFTGPRPLHELKSLLEQADVLVSPRISGNNTPMKLYSYLHAGRPILATNLETHTQVLDSGNSLLADPAPSAFASGIVRLANDGPLRERLATSARRAAEENYTLPIFRERLLAIYSAIKGLFSPETMIP